MADKDILAYQQFLASKAGAAPGGLPGSYGQFTKPKGPAAKKPISTGIGSMIGGTLGGIAGGVLGSFAAPGVGTVAGGVAGGAGGSALGEALDQILTGGRVKSVKQVAGEAALGAAPGLLGTGFKALKAGRAGLGLADYLAADAAKQAATKAAGQAGKMTVSGKLNTYADNLLASQYGTISKPVARATQLPKTVNTLSKYGITKPADAERIAGQFTGATGEVSKAVRGAIGTAGKIDPSGIRKLAESQVVDQQIDPNKAKSLLKFLDVRLQKLGPGKAQDAFDVIKRLESKAADLKGKGGTYHLPTSEDIALAKVHTNIADALKEQVYKQANIKKVLTPDLQAKLVSLHPGNPKWQQFIDNTVMKSKDVGELRSTMAPFVKVSQAIDEGSLNSVTASGRVGNAVNGGLVSSILHATVNSDAAKRAGAAGLRTAASITPSVGGGAANLAGSGLAQGGIREAVAPFTGGMTTRGLYAQKGATADQFPDQPNYNGMAVANQGGSALTDAINQAQGGSDPTNPFSPENLQAMAIQDIQTTGGKNLDKIAKLSSLFGQEANKPKPLSAEASKQVANAQSGLSALQDLGAMLGKDPNLTIKDLAPGSIGKGITGAGQYEAAKQEIVDVLARLRTGAAISKQEETRFKAMLPQVGDSPDTVQAKLARYQSLFESVLQNQQAGSPSLETLQ